MECFVFLEQFHFCYWDLNELLKDEYQDMEWDSRIFSAVHVVMYVYKW